MIEIDWPCEPIWIVNGAPLELPYQYMDNENPPQAIDMTGWTIRVVMQIPDAPIDLTIGSGITWDFQPLGKFTVLFTAQQVAMMPIGRPVRMLTYFQPPGEIEQVYFVEIFEAK